MVDAQFEKKLPFSKLLFFSHFPNGCSGNFRPWQKLSKMYQRCVEKLFLFKKKLINSPKMLVFIE